MAVRPRPAHISLRHTAGILRRDNSVCAIPSADQPGLLGTVEIADSAGDFQKWIYGVLGATLAGWGVFVAFIAHYPFQQREKWAWNCILAGLLVWFVIDMAISLSFKVYFNVAFNTALFAAVVLPLWFSRKHFS